jgi:carboxyl-terminal processing protease
MSRRFRLAVVSTSTVFIVFLLLGAVLGHGADTSSADPYRHIQVYTEVFSRIKGEYVEEPDMKNVTLGAINGLLVSLDPFASYLNADQYKQYLKSKETAKAGVGLILSRKYGYEISIVDAIPGSPADKAGLSTGDLIEAINGISTRDMPLAYADVLLQGEAGTSLELTVLRLRKPEPAKIALTRSVIKQPALTSKMVDAETGLVKVQSLEPGRVDAIRQSITDLEKQGAKKLLLDVRDCATNEPSEGIGLANLFLEKGTIGSLSGQKVAKQVFEADPSKVVFKGPLVVMTNRGTAGGAEVAAAALLDDKRAQIVGERTYGEASLRKAITTEDGGAVLLAVAKYYGPSGKAIQDTSVVPTVTVADTDVETDDDSDTKTETPKTTEDQILKKALEVLQKGPDQVASKPARPAGVREPEKILTPLGVPQPRP